MSSAASTTGGANTSLTSGASSSFLTPSEKRRLRLEMRRKFQSKVMVLPAGVDTGKFLEEQLRYVPDDTIGPKQIRPPAEMRKLINDQSAAKEDFF